MSSLRADNFGSSRRVMDTPSKPCRACSSASLVDLSRPALDTERCTTQFRTSSGRIPYRRSRMRSKSSRNAVALSSESRLTDSLLGQHFLALLGIALFFSARRRQRELEHFVDGLHVMNLQVLKLFRREVFLNVGLVFGGQNHVVDSGTLRGQDLFLDSTYRQHISAQRDFAGHGG